MAVRLKKAMGIFGGDDKKGVTGTVRNFAWPHGDFVTLFVCGG